ncbi:multidrug efflux SMR transporter [Herbiconiux sp. CPCC 205716]|uniref:Multidrug efflux SMR transporter n=1 Tax=Herbiconiux gentiana TaxID=2970912 RepID=A0ABT2GCU0_9MICO|nr:multidrug efflux SMR transporter [Herbiconiux gentiana]MCS5714005.1 multidrug efflux SMR transporter [Herbiconiux gentiana]
MIWLLLAGAIVTEVAATLALRASEGFRKRRWIAPVVVFYLLAFTLLAIALAGGLPVGIAYGIWAACGVALTAILARILFKEKLTPRMIAGIALIAVGVFVIELGAAH